MSVCESGANNVQVTDDNGRKILQEVYESTDEIRNSADMQAIGIASTVNEGFTGVERQEGFERLSNEGGQIEIRKLLDRNHCATLMAETQTILENLKAHCETDKLAKHNKIEICSLQNDLARQAEENHSDLQFEAFKYKEELARQEEECCCELKVQKLFEACAIKEKLDKQARETQLLARETESQRVRDELKFATTANILKKFCKPIPL